MSHILHHSSGQEPQNLPLAPFKRLPQTLKDLLEGCEGDICSFLSDEQKALFSFYHPHSSTRSAMAACDKKFVVESFISSRLFYHLFSDDLFHPFVKEGGGHNEKEDFERL